MQIRIAALSLIVLLGLMGCSNPTTSTTTQPEQIKIINEPTIKPGDSVPAPSGEVILSLQGAIGQSNVDGRLDFDMTTLEQIGLIEFSVDDPHIGKRITYQGVPISALLAVAQVSNSAAEIDARALNDYEATLQIQAIKDWPVIIATKRDGERMSIVDKGPLEIVFPYGIYPINPDEFNNLWVWQLRALEIR